MVRQVQVSDDPIIVQLLFEPNGRPLDESNYYLHEKENVCVVCGASESYIRKNIIPREYRKYVLNVQLWIWSHRVTYSLCYVGFSVASRRGIAEYTEYGCWAILVIAQLAILAASLISIIQGLVALLGTG